MNLLVELIIQRLTHIESLNHLLNQFV